MADATHRILSYFHLVLGTDKKNAPYNTFTAKDIFTIIGNKCFSLPSLTRPYKNDSLIYSIADCIYDPIQNLAVILITCSDKNASNPCFEDVTKQTIRVAKKEVNEGIAHSCHLAIDLTSPTQNNEYIAIIEKVQGVSKGNIEQFLHAALKKLLGSRKINKDEKAKLKLSLNIIPENIAEDMKNGGRLASLTLETNRREDGLDEEKWIGKLKKQLKITIAKDTKLSDVLNFCTTQKGEYPTVRVEYVTSAGCQRCAQSEEFTNSLEFLFGKVESIVIRPALDDASESINSTLAKELFTKLLKERK